jgi:hypothetical protein
MQPTVFALSFMALTEGASKDARTAMMLMTIRSSINVKERFPPADLRGSFLFPGCAIGLKDLFQ